VINCKEPVKRKNHRRRVEVRRNQIIEGLLIELEAIKVNFQYKKRRWFPSVIAEFLNLS
jgi:hypothetical protein